MMDYEGALWAVVGLSLLVGSVLRWRESIVATWRALWSRRGYDKLSTEQELVSNEYSRNAEKNVLSIANIQWSNILRLKLNGKDMEIVNPDPSELLSHFVREKMYLRGTKLGCEEGGCGACSVMVETVDGRVVAANSCLRLLCLNDGASLTTVEGIGSVKSGLSSEQQSIVSHNGTQCGFCTPGWVTAMHALRTAAAKEGQPMTKADVDKKLDGNLCRCTGYRPIMNAFHSLCTGQEEIDHCRDLLSDIEDMRACPKLHAAPAAHPAKKASAALAPRSVSYSPEPLFFQNCVSGDKYYRPVTLAQLGAVLRHYPRGLVQLVGGNTSIGVTKYLNNTAPIYLPNHSPVMVDVNHVPELRRVQFSADPAPRLEFGASVTITEAIAALLKHSPPAPRDDQTVPSAHADDQFAVVNHHSVFNVLAYHFHRIANTQLRNAGTWAGNAMLFLQYKGFASDAILAMVTADVLLHVYNVNTETLQAVTMADFMGYSYEEFTASGNILLSMSVEDKHEAGLETVTETFKMARRERNAHAFVDAGFHFKIRRDARGVPTCTYARIVFGAIAPTIFVAKATESALLNQPLTAASLQRALQAFQQDWTAAGGVVSELTSYSFITSAAPACIYRFFLRCYPPHLLPANVFSALLPWVKPRSRGVEVYPINRQDDPLSPVGQAVAKIEAPIQATGEAVYPSDEPLPPNGVFGAILFSTVAARDFVGLDLSQVCKGGKFVEGVVDVITAKDIPGSNQTGTGVPLFVELGSTVHCAGAPLGCVLATSQEAAERALLKIKVLYGPQAAAPIVTLVAAVAAKQFFPTPDGLGSIVVGDASAAIAQAQFSVSDRVSAAGQAHFYLETHAANASLVDGDRVSIVCGTQMPTANQDTIAAVLNVPSNRLAVTCPRIGGAFGGKLTGGVINAAAAALACQKLRRPVRIFNSRTADMNMQGGREEWLADYTVGFDADGKVRGLRYDFFLDAGAGSTDTVGGLFMGMFWADNAYSFPDYQASAVMAQTATPPRTSMRAPGVVQASLITEMVIERVAVELGLPLRAVQERNFIQDGDTAICGQVISDCTLQSVWAKIMAQAQFDAREQRVQAFNRGSLWRKRGLACAPVKYGMGWAGYNAGVRLGVHQSDGCVVVTHSGVEMGQGINTKVAQAVAYALGVDLALIRIERTSTSAVVNGGPTGGSGTSEVTVQAALDACDALNRKLDPFRGQAAPPARQPMTADQWRALLARVPPSVNLNVDGWFSPLANPNREFFQYFVYAACVTEVELNVLSGEVHVLSSEIVYDCGKSLNPAVDIGQIEGALVQGIGYFFHEKVLYGEGSGVLKTIGTWEYKPPMAQDIPSTLNVTLIADAYNQNGILGSKAVAEPPYVVSNSAYFALKMAIGSARQDAGHPGYFNLPVPCTVDDRQVACLVSPQRYVLPQ